MNTNTSIPISYANDCSHDNNNNNNNNNPYIQNTPSSCPDAYYAIGKTIERAAQTAGNLFTRFNPAARFMFNLTHDQIYRRDFGVVPGEKLMNAHPCCFSTSGGPVPGTLYVSNVRIAFSGDDPIMLSIGRGPVQWVNYKVVITVDRIQTVSSVKNGDRNLGDEYISIKTKDGYEFWFMGFKDRYVMAFENLFQAINRNCNH